MTKFAGLAIRAGAIALIAGLAVSQTTVSASAQENWATSQDSWTSGSLPETKYFKVSPGKKGKKSKKPIIKIPGGLGIGSLSKLNTSSIGGSDDKCEAAISKLMRSGKFAMNSLQSACMN